MPARESESASQEGESHAMQLGADLAAPRIALEDLVAAESRSISQAMQEEAPQAASDEGTAAALGAPSVGKIKKLLYWPWRADENRLMYGYSQQSPVDVHRSD